jgi:hypothetical protein
MASKFLSDLITKDRSKDFPQKIRFELETDLGYQSDVLGKVVTVPVGFVTDFASIPQILWSVLSPVGGYDEAAVVHDYLYTIAITDRGTADKVLNEAMQVLEVEGWKRKAIYAGVRLGGWHAWRLHRKASGS